MKTYVTFGQKHVHKKQGKRIDKNCVVVLEGGKKPFDLFGAQYAFEYPEEVWSDANLKYYPRGYIYL